MISKEIQNFHQYCTQSIEKAYSQTTQNPTLSTEALSAALLLAIHLESDCAIGKLNNFVSFKT